MKKPEEIGRGVAGFVQLLRILNQLKSDGLISEKEFDHLEDGVRCRILSMCNLRLTRRDQEIFTHVGFSYDEEKTSKSTHQQNKIHG